jgi:hypothetical protein
MLISHSDVCVCFDYLLIWIGYFFYNVYVSISGDLFGGAIIRNNTLIFIHLLYFTYLILIRQHFTINSYFNTLFVISNIKMIT